MSDVPEDANEHCPGTQSDQAGMASACAGCPNQSACASGETKRRDDDIPIIKDRLKEVKNVILVLSGKGGVGKSAVAANLARALAVDETKQIGLLDIDICGPSQARIMGVEIESVHESAEGWCPILVQENLFVMSIAFLLNGRNDAVIWRGPRKNMLIKQFLKDVSWGPLDYLIVDTPPGTSDEHISVVQFLLQASIEAGAIIVTTPQEISLLDVRKEVTFCNKTNTPIIGIIENMASFICPCCSNKSDLFPASTGGAKQMCKEMSTKLLASLPFDTRITECADEGKNFFELYPESPLCKVFLDLAKQLSSI